MKPTTIYVAAMQKQQKNVACFGITTTKKHARKIQEYSGIFQSNGRNEAQLKAIIHSINLAEEAEEINLFTESNIIENFLNGTVGTWELADWCKGNGKRIENADLWRELNGLVESRNVNFHKPKVKKEMSQVNKLMNAEKANPEVFMTMNVATVTQAEAELTQEEADQLVVNTLLATQDVSELSQAETDQIVKAIMVETQKALTAVSTKPVATADGSALTIDLDAKTRKECDVLFEELGLDTTTAVKMFLKQCIRTQNIKLDLKLD